jgi:hypothetical protein
MAYVVSGEPGKGSPVDFKEDFEYEYPDDLDLHPASDLHKALVTKIIQRAQESHNEMQKRYGSWNEIDRLLTTYIPVTDKEKTIKDKDTRKPISIVFPYTYSMMEALLTYLTMAFFQDPMFQYEGFGPDDVKGAMLLELVVKLHCIKTKVPLAVHTVLRDSLGYGVGVGIPGWEIKHGKRAVQTSSSTESELGSSKRQGMEWVDDVIFEGNRLDNVDPYLYLPDPNVSADRVQDGEFVGWLVRTNYMSCMAEEQDSSGSMFNVKYLKSMKHRRSKFSTDESERQRKHGGAPSQSPQSTNPIDKLYMYVDLIPKDWKLGEGEYPEKWLFCLASDAVIISAEKCDHAHGMYPVATAAPEYDGYSATPIGRLEILYGLQGVLDWLFNSHVANVRKAINDMIVVDPYLVNINDLKDPEPGKLIRLRRPAWGKGVDKVVQQLQINDITRANISDSAYITQWMDRISGADQSMSGQQRQGGPERLTKGEFQGTRGSAMGRLQRIAMIIGMQFMQDIGGMYAVHTQQYMDKELFVRLVGRHQEQFETIFGPSSVTKGRAKVGPYDLAIDYDVLVRDGSIPGANFSEAWVHLFRTIGGSPELQQQFDVTRIFMHIATQLGAKNVEDFKRVAANTNVQQMPDDQVASEVQKGNLVPLQQ